MVTYGDVCGPTAPSASAMTSVGTITVPTGVRLRIIGVWCALGIDQAATTTAQQIPIVGDIKIESSTPGFPKPLKLPFMMHGMVGIDGNVAGAVQGGLCEVVIIPVDIPVQPAATLTCYIDLEESPGTGTVAEIGVIYEG